MSERARSEDAGPADSAAPPPEADEVRGSGSESPPRPAIVERLLARRDRHKKRSKAVRGAWVVAGFLLIVGGLAIGVLPGPGPVILVPLGLAMLALEFVWAERLLERALVYANRAKEGATGLNGWQKALTVCLALLLVAGTYAVAAWLWELPGPLSG